MKNEDRMQLNIRKTINKIGTFRKYLVRNNNNIQTRKASDNKDSTIIRIARNAYLSSFRLMVVRNSHQLDLNHSSSSFTLSHCFLFRRYLSFYHNKSRASKQWILNLEVLTFRCAGARATLSEDPRSNSARSSGLGPGRPSSLLGLEVVLWWQGVGGSEPLLVEFVLYERFADTFLRGRRPSSREMSAVRGFAISASSICP